MRYSVAFLLVFLSLRIKIFRHGDRTITEKEKYPKDPYNETIYEPFGIGQLTNKGKARVYHLGQSLKKRYDDLLGDDYEPGILYGYSTNTDRTKMSLQLALAGLFPPTEAFQWNKTVDWIPIPVHYNFETFDFLNTAYACRVFEKMFNTTMALPQLQRKLTKYKDFIKYLSNSTGLPSDPQIAIHLHENIHSQMNLGYDYPDWCNDEVYAQLRNVSAFRCDVYAYTDSMRKLVAGPLIRRFLRNIEISGNGRARIYLNCAHDDNVATFVRAHNLAEPRMADYASGIVLFELLEGKDGPEYVRILFYPGEGDEFRVLKLKDCNKVCPLEKYKKIVEPILPFGDGVPSVFTRKLIKTSKTSSAAQALTNSQTYSN